MKKFSILFIMITALTISSSSSGSPLTGTLDQQTTSGNIISTTSINFYSYVESYTTGGITFTYPAGLFTLPPLVQVAVQPNAPHPNTETFGAEISANSATSTTVMVYKVQFGVVNEAANGSVTIHLLAIADPV